MSALRATYHVARADWLERPLTPEREVPNGGRLY